MPLRSKENTIAGFKACGIVPFDPERVLNKVSRNVPQNENIQQNELAWREALVEHLDRLKTFTVNATKRGKKN